MAACQGGRLVVHFINRKNARFDFPHDRGHHHLVLRYVHLLGLTLMAAGLIGVWYADLRSRQVRDLNLPLFAELVFRTESHVNGDAARPS